MMEKKKLNKSKLAIYRNKLTSLYFSIQKSAWPPYGISVDEDVRPSEGEQAFEEGPLPEGVEPEKQKVYFCKI